MKRAVAVLALLSAPVLATAIRPFAGMRGDANIGGNTPNGSPTSAVPWPTFDLVAGATTPNDLPDALTVNSVTLDLVCSLTAQDVSGTNLVGRTQSGTVTFSEAGSGASPVVSVLTPSHALDAAERGIFYTAAQKYHQAGVSDCDIGSEDFVIEGIFGPARSTNASIFINTDATNGFSLQNNSLSNLRLAIRTGGVATVIDGGNPLGWSHAIWFVDRDEATTNGAIAYTNGLPGTGVNVSARVGSLSSTVAASIGAATTNSGTVVGVRIWKCPSGTPQCFVGGATNLAQWAPIARQRAALALGVSPAIAAGSPAPTTLTRATTAHVDVVDGNTRQLYLAGVSAPRVARRTHSGGTAVSGYLSEPAVSNIALQSQTLGTTWAAITAGDNVLADAYAGADLSVTGDDIDGNNSNAEHGLRQGITLTAAAHTFSAWAKTGTQNFVALRNATIANGVAWFDVATCTSSSCVVGENCTSAVGTTQAGISRASAERYPIDTTGDGVADVNLCRVSITYTGTAASHNHDLLCAPSNGNLAYTDSDAAADCGFWGVRVEAFPVATSYLATTTAAAARNADDVRFDGASHYTGSPSTMDTAVLCPSFDTGVQSTFASVGTGAANYARLGVDATADRGQGGADVAGVQWLITASSGDISDGVTHALRQTMETNNVQAYSDGVSIGTDTLATLPTVASSFVYFGTAGGTASQSACLISRTRLWSSIVTPAVAP
jgi:hypothetical protein